MTPTSTLRRLAIAGPLGAAAAMLSHAVLFGHGHAAGGDHEGGLIGSVLTALTVLFLATITGAAAVGRTVREGRQPSLGTMAGWSAAGAALGLGVLEAAEGHGLGILASAQILVVLPVAALVSLAGAIVLGLARRIGRALAPDPERGRFGRIVRLGPPQPVLVPVRIAPASRRGRAPPR